ncbi:MAG: glycosyltransferase [Alphaproteobacteria bacterium]|nr:glycosyltransferase [Alphaproteobacteria bacterium]
MGEPRVLAFYLGHRGHYRDVMLSPDEVFVSPHCEDGGDARGIRTLRSPPGRYDVRQILARLPAEQHPDLVVVKIDATLGNIPCGLAALPCPKVLILGDTHHLDEPIRRLLDYAAAERFDRIVTDCNRQHLHFFRAAGFPRVHWLPHLTWRPNWREPAAVPDRDMVFVGQTGAFHPWRQQVIRHIQSAGLPLAIGRMTQDEAANVYSSARISFNCSLNGDLNLRIFEVLSAGGFLLTDRLSKQAGLDRLLDEGSHYAGWSTLDELVEKARHYLAHPAEAETIRRAGRRCLEERFNPEIQRRRFFDLLSDGREDPLFAIDDEIRCRIVVPVPRIELETRVAVYERLQAIHKTAAQVRLFVPVPFATTATDGGDLPRLVIADWAALREPVAERPRFSEAESDAAAIEHVLVLSPRAKGIDELLASFQGCHVFVEGGRLELCHEAFLEVVTELARWGFAATDPRAGAFIRRDALAAADGLRSVGRVDQALALVDFHLGRTNTAALCVAWADQAEALGAVTQFEQLLAKAVRLDRNRRDALLRLGRARLAGGDSSSCYLFLNEARRLAQPLPDEDERVWRDLDGKAMAAQPRSPYVAAMAPERRAPRVRPRRILLVTNLFPPEEMGGYGRKLWEFADSLVRRGHMVRVLTGSAEYLRKPQDPGEDRLEPFVARVLQLYGAWTGGKTDMCTDMDGARAMVRHNTQTVLNVVQDIRPDLVLVGNVDYLGLDYIAPLLEAGVPVIHSLGSRHPSYTHEMEPRHPLYLAAPASRWVAEEMKDGGWAIDRWTVLYPGARTQYFYRLFLPETERLRIFFAGLVLPYKGPQTLIHALSILHGRGIDFQCTLAGDTTDQAFVDGLKNACQQIGMAHKVNFVGFQDRAGLARMLNAHNVVVFPSIVLEAFGIVHVEAMAAGLACVTTATGGGREIVRDGIDGLLFPPQDGNALATKLLALHDDRGLWRQLQQAGRERALEFSVERSVDVLEDAMETLIAAKGVVHA